MTQVTKPETKTKHFANSKTVWGLIMGLIGYWGMATGLTLDAVITHLQDAWNSVAAILVVLGLRNAEGKLTIKK